MDLKERKAQLQLDYNHKIELHSHTRPASGCSDVKPRDLMEVYKELGFGAVCITNHFYFSEKLSKNEVVRCCLNDFFEAKEYGDRLGIKAYLGAEIRFTENINDYLVYGVNQEILEEIYDLLPYGVENFRQNYLMENSVFIQAHPMRDGMTKIPSELLDGIEVFNMHPGHNSRIGLAARYAKENNVPIITAGSDYHNANKKHEGLAAMRTAYLPEDSFGLAQILKAGDYVLEIGNEMVIP